MPLSTAAPLGFFRPEIPTLVPEPPSGEGLIHEIKHDGYRTLVVIDQGKVRAFSRHGRGLDRPLSPSSRGRRQTTLQGGYHRWRDHRPGREWHLRLRCPAVSDP